MSWSDHGDDSVLLSLSVHGDDSVLLSLSVHGGDGDPLRESGRMTYVKRIDGVETFRDCWAEVLL